MLIKIRKFKKLISFALFMTSYMTTSLLIHSMCLFSFDLLCACEVPDLETSHVVLLNDLFVKPFSIA